MKKLDELISILDRTPQHMIMHVGMSQLLKPINWNQLLKEFIENLSDDQFFESVDKMHIPHVDPHVFMIHENPGRYQLVVHHFDLERFNKYMNQNRIGAHHHHFSFATRILRGGYTNVLFENKGSLSSPKLTPALQNRCERGSVYIIDYRQYHCVFRPEDKSMSFMIRTAPELDPGHPKDSEYTRERILTEKKVLIGLLSEKYPTIAGVSDEYDFFNPASVLGLNPYE